MKGEPFRAWQPLTFGGVARFGHDWIGRLFIIGAIASLLATAAAIFTARRAWLPVIEQSIEQLPQGAEIRGGRFQAPQSARLAENSFLSIRFDPQDTLTTHSTAEIEATFTADELRLRSLFGIAALKYPAQWTISLTRSEMEPKWGAWKPAVFGYLAAGVIANLFVSWIGLGIVYALIPRLLAIFLRRHLTLWGAFKLSIAAMMPGAIFFTIAIALYGLSQIRLVELIGAWIMHFVIGWIFLIGAAFRLPPLGKANPFEPVKESEAAEDRPVKQKNPFKKSKR
jgi:hypothetical protein